MQHLRLTSAAAALLALAGLQHAQTTHVVNLQGFDYNPAHITIDVGDTVQWNWVSGLHDVKSGQFGIVDGIFDSGAPVMGPMTFDITFDQAFLDANPVPGNVYDYFCSIHITFDMVGSVTVNAPVAPVVTEFGCTGPAGSILDVSGAPIVGQAWTVGVDNPVLGGQPAGSLAFLGVSINPAPGFPCGLPLPGFHMDPLVPSGELLIGIGGPDPLVTLGPNVWLGAGSPSNFALPIPPNPGLVGIELHVQGLVVDPTFTNTFGASRGLKAKIGG